MFTCGTWQCWGISRSPVGIRDTFCHDGISIFHLEEREKRESGFMSFSVQTALYNASYFRKSPSPDNHTDMGKTERGKHNSFASSLQKNIVKLYTVIKLQISLFIYY